MAINAVAQNDAAMVASQTALTNLNKTQSAAKEPTPVTKHPAAVKDNVQISTAAEEAAKVAQQGNKPSSILQPE